MKALGSAFGGDEAEAAIMPKQADYSAMPYIESKTLTEKSKTASANGINNPTEDKPNSVTVVEDGSGVTKVVKTWFGTNGNEKFKYTSVSTDIGNVKDNGVAVYVYADPVDANNKPIPNKNLRYREQYKVNGKITGWSEWKDTDTKATTTKSTGTKATTTKTRGRQL